MVVPLFILTGGIITELTSAYFTNPENAGALVGSVIQLLGLVTAVAAGASALRTGR